MSEGTRHPQVWDEVFEDLATRGSRPTVASARIFRVFTRQPRVKAEVLRDALALNRASASLRHQPGGRVGDRRHPAAGQPRRAWPRCGHGGHSAAGSRLARLRRGRPAPEAGERSSGGDGMVGEILVGAVTRRGRRRAQRGRLCLLAPIAAGSSLRREGVESHPCALGQPGLGDPVDEVLALVVLPLDEHAPSVCRDRGDVAATSHSALGAAPRPVGSR